MYDICGLGGSTLDYLTIVEEFPSQEGVYEVKESALQGGGPVSTALIMAAKLGAKTAMMDALGDTTSDATSDVAGADWRSALILQEFKDYGVETGYIRANPGCRAAMSSIHVRERDGARAIIFAASTAKQLIDSARQRELVKNSKILHMSGRYMETCLELSVCAKQHGVKVSLDGGAGRYKPDFDPLLAMVDYCIVARDFALSWLGEDHNMQRLSEKIMDKGPELAVITDGAQGSYICSRNGFFHQPAFHIDRVKDTTGCGDIYHGAFLYGLSRGMELQETAKLASACAALKARHLGGRGYVASLGEAQEFMNLTNVGTNSSR